MEVENIREILKKNIDPLEIIELSIKSFLNILYVPKKVIPIVNKKEFFLILPYLETMSSNLKQKLRTCFKNSLPQCNIKIILNSTNRLSSLSRFNDVIPKELQSINYNYVVYKFLCGNFNINGRYGEHLDTSHLTGKQVECKPPAV